MTLDPSFDTAATEGWFFLLPQAVPEEWMDRAIPVSLLRLSAEEAHSLLSNEWKRGLEPEMVELARLLVDGRSGPEIARALSMSERTVHRRIAWLRRKFGTATTHELLLELAARGFRD